MIDHILGRPNVAVRKYQVFAVVVAWALYLLRGNKHGPAGVRRLSSILTRRLSIWQTVILAGVIHYVLRNFGKIMGLECPEPLANLYEPAYFRATWATTALDAGFWTAMKIRRSWLRHLCSIIFTCYYLVCAEQADEKVRAVRSVVTVEHLRNSWNKTQENPILRVVTRLLRRHTMKYNPREIRIPRPQGSTYTDPVRGWLYYDGPISALKRQTKLILNMPGGGFVAMSPRTHDDALMAWAAKTGLPILSLDYGKAPEHPYPYALHECLDVYRMLIQSRGRCVGLFSDMMPQIILSGDSAGGSLAAALTIMVIEDGFASRRSQSDRAPLPVPAGLVLIYPCLDVNIGNWMTDEQMALIRDKDSRHTNQRVLRRKTSVYMHTAATPYASCSESSDSEHDSGPPFDLMHSRIGVLDEDATTRPAFRTRVAVPSMISYFSDRLLTPEMMRAMIILYIGRHRKPNFATDYYLSPVLTPDHILARFPKTYFLTGERDPLVDDTCIMAGRLRQAKRSVLGRSSLTSDGDSIRVQLIEGISHGFLQMGGVYPKTWEFIDTIGSWYDELFSEADQEEREQARQMAMTKRQLRTQAQRSLLESENFKKNYAVVNGHASTASNGAERRRNDQSTETAATTSDESDAPLEMSVKPLTTSNHANANAKVERPKLTKKRSPTAGTARRASYQGSQSRGASNDSYGEIVGKPSLARHVSNDSQERRSKASSRVSKANNTARRKSAKLKVRSDSATQQPHNADTMDSASEHSATPSDDEEVVESPSPLEESPLAREHPIKRGSTWDKRMSRVSLAEAMKEDEASEGATIT